MIILKNRKANIGVTLFFVILLSVLQYSNSLCCYDFRCEPDSLYRDVTHIDFTIPLEEGFYCIVFDNTECLTVVSQACVQYSGSIEIDMNGSIYYKSVNHFCPSSAIYVQYYSSESFNVSGNRNVTFRFDMSENVTFFVVTENNFCNYKIELELLLEKQQTQRRFRRVVISTIFGEGVFFMIIVMFRDRLKSFISK